MKTNKFNIAVTVVNYEYNIPNCIRHCNFFKWRKIRNREFGIVLKFK